MYRHDRSIVRFSPCLLVEDLSSLTQDQKSWICSTGFGSVLSFELKEYPLEISRFLLMVFFFGLKYSMYKIYSENTIKNLASYVFMYRLYKCERTIFRFRPFMLIDVLSSLSHDQKRYGSVDLGSYISPSSSVLNVQFWILIRSHASALTDFIYYKIWEHMLIIYVCLTDQNLCWSIADYLLWSMRYGACDKLFETLIV